MCYIECEAGYHTYEVGTKCESCPKNLYGKKCAFTCNCKENDRYAICGCFKCNVFIIAVKKKKILSYILLIFLKYTKGVSHITCFK